MAASAVHAGAASATVYSLTSSADLDRDGWTFTATHNITPIFSSQGLLLAGLGVGEWLLLLDEPSNVFSAASDATGWWLEARVTLPAGQSCLPFDAGVGELTEGGPGIGVHDGTNLLTVNMTQAGVGLTYPEVRMVARDLSGEHRFRVQNLGQRHIQVLVDGEIVIDVPRLLWSGSGTRALRFGNLGGSCRAGASGWRNLTFDTRSSGMPPGDADRDGTPNVSDTCVLVANPDQLDTDGDRIGDVCDPCPRDRDNDVDGDRLCADVDPCPTDPMNEAKNPATCGAPPHTTPPSGSGGTAIDFRGSGGLDNWGYGGLGGAPPGSGGRSAGGAGGLGATGGFPTGGLLDQWLAGGTTGDGVPRGAGATESTASSSAAASTDAKSCDCALGRAHREAASFAALPLLALLALRGRGTGRARRP